MAGGANRLKFVLDQNLGRHVLGFLRSSEVCSPDQVTSLEELGYARDLADEEWIADLGKRGGYIAVTRDGNILNAAIRRDAWISSGLGMLLLDKKWGMLPRREWPRHLLYWWPYMTTRVLSGQPGGAWTVACRIAEPPKEWIKAVTGPRISD
jgi:hypothetical protein